MTALQNHGVSLVSIQAVIPPVFRDASLMITAMRARRPSVAAQPVRELMPEVAATCVMVAACRQQRPQGVGFQANIL